MRRKKDFLDISTAEQIKTINDIKTKINNLNIPIKKWYKTQYPEDELADYIKIKITFADIYSALFINKSDIYDILGTGDSLVRERVFRELSSLLKVPYINIYNAWLNT